MTPKSCRLVYLYANIFLPYTANIHQLLTHVFTTNMFTVGLIKIIKIYLWKHSETLLFLFWIKKDVMFPCIQFMLPYIGSKHFWGNLHQRTIFMLLLKYWFFGNVDFQGWILGILVLGDGRECILKMCGI